MYVQTCRHAHVHVIKVEKEQRLIIQLLVLAAGMTRITIQETAKQGFNLKFLINPLKNRKNNYLCIILNIYLFYQ